MTQSAQRRTRRALIVAVVMFVVLAIIAGRSGKPSPIFADNLTLAAAEAAARADGKAVLVLVSADWCPPCKTLKKGALADQEIVAWVRAATHPVLIDVSTAATPESERLKVFSIPAMFVLREGQPVAKLEGDPGESRVRAWLHEHTGATADHAARNKVD